MSVWLVITNPYAYDQAMWQAIEAAKNNSTSLHVVFFICDESIGEMMHDLGEMGFMGAGSFRNLKKSMFSGYRSLAEDVIKRVERKTQDVDLIVEGVVEEPFLAAYLLKILTSDVTKVVVAGSRLFTPKLGKLPKTVVYIEE